MTVIPHNYILIGPQGSGKGTQAEALRRRFRLAPIGMGDLFRSAARRRNALGGTLRRIVNQKGSLVPFSLTTRVLTLALDRVPRSRGIVFDGFPRTLLQARWLERFFERTGRSAPTVIHLPVSAATTVRRLSLRRVCDRHGHIFILGKNLRRGATVCPRCDGKIIQRSDDHPIVIRRRLAIYRRETRPLLSFYRRRRRLLTVDGEPSIPVVTKRLFTALRRRDRS